MNGPDHYREAERLLRISDNCRPSDDLDRTAVMTALVHATLAQTAATALQTIELARLDLEDGVAESVEQWRRAVMESAPAPAMPQLSPAWPAEPIRMWDHNWCQTTDPARTRYITVDRPEGTRAVLDVAQEVK